MQTTGDSLESAYNRSEIEERIHHEFSAAFAAWEEEPEEQKADASLRLNKTVRQLYDFVVRGELPQRKIAAYHAGSARF